MLLAFSALAMRPPNHHAPGLTYTQQAKIQITSQVDFMTVYGDDMSQ